METPAILAILVAFALLVWGVLRVVAITRERQSLLESYQSLKEQARLWKLVAEKASDGLVVQHLNGRILWANTAFCEGLEYKLSELIGRNPLSFLIPEDEKPSEEFIRNFNYAENQHEFDQYILVRNVRRSGEEFFNQLNSSRVKMEGEHGGEVVIVSCRDVTEQVGQEDQLKVAHNQLLELARTDDLTGLANRKWFTEVLDQSLKSANDTDAPLALLQIDLDYFKEMNDTYGHCAGDAVLRHVARILSKNLRPGDLVARLGGDEFAMIVPNAPSLEVLLERARKISREIRAPLSWEEASLTSSTTIGIARSETNTSTAESVTNQADFALYFAKDKHRGGVAAFDAELKTHYDERRKLNADVADAIRSQNLDFVFQPIYDSHRRTVSGFETLCRWQHETRGMVSPATFIPIVKELGRTLDLDLMAASACLNMLHDLGQQGFEDVAVNVNVSPETLMTPTFSDFILWETERLGLDARLVHLEILEDTFFSTDQGNDLAAEHVTRLRTAGFVVMLDDFGAGFAGLTHLARLDVTGIKIDRSLIDPLPHDRQTSLIVQSIYELSQKLGLKIVAEGVETQAQADYLDRMGCTIQQGYFYQRPRAKWDILNWLKEDSKSAQAEKGSLRAL